MSDTDGVILGRAITYALIEQDREALEEAFSRLGTNREAQLGHALALVWAEMLPPYLAANPDARILSDGKRMVEEISDWLEFGEPQ